MRKITLLVSLSLCAAGAFAQAPAKKSIRTRLTAPRTAVTGKATVSQIKEKISKKRKAAAGQPVWKPANEDFYIYEEGEWLPMASSIMTYDKAGNLLTIITDEDGWLTRNTYTYDAHNMVTSAIEESDESGSGEEWLNESKTLRTYDPIVTDFATSKMEYKWDDVENDWGPGDKQSNRYTVTRDEKGRVVALEITAYFSYTGSWDLVSRFDITYDATTGKAVTYAYRQADEYDPATGKTTLGAPTTYKNIEWENTDGQILKDFDELVLGANRFKKADIYYGEGEEEELIGHYEVTYADGKADFTVTGISADGTEKEVRTYTTTDANGSFVEEIAYYTDEDEDGTLTEEECIRESLVMKYDHLGNCTLEEYHGQETPDSEDEIIGGSRTTYTYDETTGAVTEALQEEYAVIYGDDDEIVSAQYEPWAKIVYSNLTDVTPVQAVEREQRGADAVYNLQGVAVGTSTDNLPAGIYIIREGGKAGKIVKR